MVLGHDVHSTDSSSLILGSSEDDEVIQEGLLRLRSVFSIASYMADFVSVKLRRCSVCVPPALSLILGQEGEKIISCTSLRDPA